MLGENLTNKTVYFSGSGDDDGEDIPVPIPNTAVKLSRAESTWGAGPWEDK